MNNANFGYDYRDNVNNAKLQRIIDKFNEITYVKKYNLFDNRVVAAEGYQVILN